MGAVLLGLATAGTLLAGPGPAAIAATVTPPRLTEADSTPAVTPAVKGPVTITSVTPAVLTPGTDVVISGTLTGNYAAPTLRVVLGETDIMRRSDVTAWADDTTPVTRGRELTTLTLPSTTAGAATPFTITVPAAQLRSIQPFGVLPIAIDVRPKGAVNPAPNTTVRTFVLWHQRKEYMPLQIGILMPVTLAANPALYSSDSAQRLGAWRSELDASGRIGQLLTATDGTSVSLAVDPAVVGAAMPQDPTVSVDMTDLLTPIRQTLTGRDVFALPLNDVDVTAVAKSPQNPLVRESLRRSTDLNTLAQIASVPGLVLPVNGELGPATPAKLNTLYATALGKQPSTLIVNSTQVKNTTNYSLATEAAGAGGTRILVSDRSLDTLLTKVAKPETSGLATQRFLAETMTLLAEAPGTDRSVLVVAPRGMDVDASALGSFLETLQTTPWLHGVPVSSLAAASSSRPLPAATLVPVVPQSGVLTPYRLGVLADQDGVITRTSTVLRDGTAFRTSNHEMLLALLSARWRGHTPEWSQLNTAVTRQTTEATDGIAVQARSYNFFADEGVLQIVVENNLDYPVENLRLVVVPSNPRLQITKQAEPITIGAKGKTTVHLSAQAIGRGQVDLRARLTTADGTPIGRAAIIKVNASPVGNWLYWVIGGLGALLLLRGLWRAWRQGSARVDEIPPEELAATLREAGQPPRHT